MPKFNHAVTLAFSVISDDPEGEDFTPAMLKAALEARIRDLDRSPGQSEWLEAVGSPFDSFKEDEPALATYVAQLRAIKHLTVEIEVEAESIEAARTLAMRKAETVVWDHSAPEDIQIEAITAK